MFAQSWVEIAVRSASTGHIAKMRAHVPVTTASTVGSKVLWPSLKEIVGAPTPPTPRGRSRGAAEDISLPDYALRRNVLADHNRVVKGRPTDRRHSVKRHGIDRLT